MIGKKIRGFEFKSTNNCTYHTGLSTVINQIGVIIEHDLIRDNYLVLFNGIQFYYPAKLCEQHLVEEETSVPTHYQSGKDYDLIDVAIHYDLNFFRFNVLKYICRAGKKDDIIKDLKKALDYLQREIKHLESI